MKTCSMQTDNMDANNRQTGNMGADRQQSGRRQSDIRDLDASSPKIRQHIQQPVYSALANVYDVLMEEVDYELWADYVDELIYRHGGEARSILELACGTGTVAMLLDQWQHYRITATDSSQSMLDRAREKAARAGSPVRFVQSDCRDLQLNERYDVVLMLFDSLNYLLHRTDIQRTFEQVRKVLRPGGIFVFDFTTPNYSPRIAGELDNEIRTTPDHYRYFRSSRYDVENRIHINDFTIRRLTGDHEQVLWESRETHYQKIYTLEEISELARGSGLHMVAAYDEFDLKPATINSDRINMILQCPNNR